MRKLEKPKNVRSFGRHELLEQRRARFKIKSKLIFILIFITFNISLLLFLRSPFFTIRVISLQGIDKLSAVEIRSTMAVKEGMNIWKISPPELEKRILTIPRVADVDVERVLPDKINITIREKSPLILVPYHGCYLELAADGIFIGIREEYAGELPLVNGLLWGKMDVGMKIPDQQRAEIMNIFLASLELTPTLPLAEINVENPQQIVVYTREGMEVWLGNKVDLSKKLEVLQSIYYRLSSPEENLMEGYLDLRVAEAPVFKPFKK